MAGKEILKGRRKSAGKTGLQAVRGDKLQGSRRQAAKRAVHPRHKLQVRQRGPPLGKKPHMYTAFPNWIAVNAPMMQDMEGY